MVCEKADDGYHLADGLVGLRKSAGFDLMWQRIADIRILQVAVLTSMNIE